MRTLGGELSRGFHTEMKCKNRQCYPELSFPALSDFRFQGVSPLLCPLMGHCPANHQVGSWSHNESWPEVSPWCTATPGAGTPSSLPAQGHLLDYSPRVASASYKQEAKQSSTKNTALSQATYPAPSLSKPVPGQRFPSKKTATVMLKRAEQGEELWCPLCYRHWTRNL